MAGAWQQTAGWMPSQQLRPAAAPYTGAVTTGAASPVLFARCLVSVWCVVTGSASAGIPARSLVGR